MRTACLPVIQTKPDRTKRSSKSLTLQEALADYVLLRGDKLSERTIKDYHWAINRYFLHWLPLRLVDITPKMVVDEHAKHRKDSPTGGNRAFQFLSQIFNFAIVYHELGIQNPVRHLSILRLWHQEHSRIDDYIEVTELDGWFKGVRNMQGQATKDLLVFLLLTGLRVGEAMQLTWKDVELDIGMAYLGSARRGSTFQTKNKRVHRLPLSTFVVALLLERKYKAPTINTHYIFESEPGKHISNPNKACRNLVRKTGIDFTPHDLRRTFCNLLTHPAVDADELELKALLNHANDVTRRHYLTVHPERLRPVLERLSQLFLREVDYPSPFRNSGLLTLQDVIDVEEVVEVAEV